MKPFKRKMNGALLWWKQHSNGSTAAVIEGARRVGKSTLVTEFVKNEYSQHLIIDFSDVKKATRALFERGLEGDMDRFLSDLQLLEKTVLTPRKSAIVFDEIQKCPKAREMIKHLVADGRYDYIETGSLISLKKNVQDVLIPSEEYSLHLGPMDFEEYLWAKGDEITVPYIKKKFESKEPVDGPMHAEIMRDYREYMVVGGMPQAVRIFLMTKYLGQADLEKRTILRLYREDIEKIPSISNIKTERIFRTVPSMLSTTSKLFSPSELRKGSRTREYYDSIDRLCDAKLLNKCIASSDPSPALLLSLDDTNFKLYLLDTGLLTSMTITDSIKPDFDLYRELILGRLSVNEGMYFENMVAQELSAKYRDLVFSVFRTDKAHRPYEVDFLMEKKGKIVPIECKSNYSMRHKSLDVFMKRYENIVDEAFVIHTGNLSVKGKITYIPIYMTQFL